MKPLTKKQIAELPIGLTIAEQPGRKFFRDMKFKRITLTMQGIAKVYSMNCRKLTKARKSFKSRKFGRLELSDGRTA